MPISHEEILQQLSSNGLVSADEVSRIRDSLVGGLSYDGELLVQQLVQEGILTGYQVDAIRQGDAKKLVLDDYIILDLIGAGGMGEVYKARHRKLDRLAAIKLLPPPSVDEPDAVERFQQELRVAAKLIHSNIVITHDAGEQDGRHFLVMEFVDGRNLAAVLDDHGPLPVEDAIDCILQAATGLEFAHSQGVIHRDIKPSNLLIDPHGVVKILDMGLARVIEGPEALGDTESHRLTQTGQIMGTYDYMAPEQAVSTHDADHRSDIYSLGCTLHRLLHHAPLYRRGTAMATLLAHREVQVPSLRAERDDVSEQLDDVFRRMLAKRPEDRYQSMSDIVEDLTACQVEVLCGGKDQPATLSRPRSISLSRFVGRDSSAPTLNQPRVEDDDATALYAEHDTRLHEASSAQPSPHRSQNQQQPSNQRRSWQSFGMGCVLGVAFMVIAIQVVICCGCYMVFTGQGASFDTGDPAPTNSETSSSQPE